MTDWIPGGAARRGFTGPHLLLSVPLPLLPSVACENVEHKEIAFASLFTIWHTDRRTKMDTRERIVASQTANDSPFFRQGPDGLNAEGERSPFAAALLVG